MADTLRETHTSTVLLLGDTAYKLKKPLDLGFSDFRELAARRRACEAEVELNRRMSPDVYRGVATVRGPDGQDCEVLVVMRRLAAERSLTQLLTSGQDVLPALRSVAQQLAELHRTYPLPEQRQDLLGPGRLHDLWGSGIDVLRAAPTVVPPGLTSWLDDVGHGWISGHAALLDTRRRDGRGVDGHGDLLADDVFVLDDGPRVLDCLEFDPDLRAVDGLHDACSLVMDLHCLGAHDEAKAFLADYCTATGDRPPHVLPEFYVAYRALVRAKVHCLRAAQGEEASGAQALLRAALCRHHLEAAGGTVVLVGGLPGSGKTTVAAALAGREGWQRVSSDDERRTSHAAGYARRDRDVVYDAMLDRAARLLSEGTDVVLDASFTHREWRAAAAELAAERHARLVQLRCAVPPATARDRIARRREGASEATPQVHDLLEREWEPWPEALELDTTRPVHETTARARTAVG